ncbi:MAG: hypothetical protein QOE58_2241 [Actinomycetota bacterium]|nr:hypothetical protein [Actinomycetota bacterium]
MRPRSRSLSRGVSLERDDLGVVDEAVDHRGGYDVVAEHFSPPAEDLVAGHDQRCPFVAGGDELEEQVGCFGLERDVADLINLCGYPHRLIYADTATMPRRGLHDLRVQAIGEARLGIVTGPRGTRAPCPAGGSGRVAPKRVWSGPGPSL